MLAHLARPSWRFAASQQRWTLSLAAALALAATVAILTTATPSGRSNAARVGSPRPDAGLMALPIAARGPVSAALGADSSGYRISGLSATNTAQQLRAAFTGRGVAVAAGAVRLHLALDQYGYGGVLRRAPAAAPRVAENRVSYDRGAVREWYANGPLGLEQGFDIPARAPHAAGPLTLSVALGGNAARRVAGGSIVLSRGAVELRYGGLLATDARGRVLRSWLTLASGHVLLRVDDARASYPLRIDPFIQQATLNASDEHADDLLGTSVAISGATIVVGSSEHQVGEHKQGAAYVFVRPASGWANATQSTELTASDGASGNLFGESVAIGGNTIVVGAPFHTVGANTLQGAAYVFVKPAEGWAGVHTENAELTAEDGQAGEAFAFTVAISANGEDIAAGMPGHTPKFGGEPGQGQVDVFVRPLEGWAGQLHEKAKLAASDGLANDNMGEALSISASGDTIATGAFLHKVGGNEGQGSAYVFLKPPGGWAGPRLQIAELTGPEAVAQEAFGYSVAATDGLLAVGALGGKHSGETSGAAWLFQEPAGGWETLIGPPSQLIPSDGVSGDQFGWSAAISPAGDTVLIGARSHQVPASGPGALYVFARPAGGWSTTTQSAELAPSGGSPGNGFGTALALSGDEVLGGAAFQPLGASEDAGAAYLFATPPSVTIASPGNGAVYSQGETVAAFYTCTAPAGANVSSCSGPVASGSPIDTSTPGAHTFVVAAKDDEGASASASVAYTVLASGAVATNAGPNQQQTNRQHAQAPLISEASESNRRWRAGNALARLTRKRVPLGTTFSFTLNASASVRFAFSRIVPGRRVRGRCVAASGRNRHARACNRKVDVAATVLAAHAGRNRLSFQGRVTASKKLRPGRYTLVLTATNAAGQSSAPVALSFTIVSR